MTQPTKYATQLGTTLAGILQGFKTSWLAVRTAQEQQKGTVGDNRTTRTNARINVELDLTKIVYFVGGLFPGDVDTCSNFFDFSLLYSQAHSHPAEKFTGNVAAGANAVALNRSF